MASKLGDTMKIATLATSLLATTLLVLACGQTAHPADKDKALWDTDDPNIIKRSRNDICHDSSDASFAKTDHFRAYQTMKDCLDSGGKRAKN